MKNKAFTLIELLAVIVVLGVIMTIAITAVNNYINSSRIKAFLVDEKMFVKAAQKYLAAGVINYPSNIGDTVEIKFSDLKSNGFIETIKSPSNQSLECDGYLIVTKVETGKYDYTPHLDCANGIGSISEDGLLAHYTFDDFQEATTNLVSNNSFESGNTSGWVLGNATSGVSEIDNNNNVFGTKSLKVTVSNGGDQYQYNSYNFGTSIAGRTFTVSAWIKTSNITGQGVSIVTYWKDSSGTWISANTIRSSYVTGNSEWTRLIATGVAPTNAYETTIIIYPDLKNGQGTYWIDGAQIEEKSYSTPFVDGTRTSIVKDYSGRNNTATLTTTNTPTWTNTGKNSEGAYTFNGSSNYIDAGNKSDFNLTNTGTVMLWARTSQSYPSNDTTSRFRGIISKTPGGGAGEQSYFIDWYGTNTSRNLRVSIGDTNGQDVVQSTNYNFNNEWHHIALVWNGSNVILYTNGKEAGRTSQTRNAQVTTKELEIGRAFSSNGYAFNGLIDDVRIYNRALSTNEIMQIYNSTK